jgi:hypothetical protein
MGVSMLIASVYIRGVWGAHTFIPYTVLTVHNEVPFDEYNSMMHIPWLIVCWCQC